MLRTSFGFHTITISLPVFDATTLFQDFVRYYKATGSITMYKENSYNTHINYKPLGIDSPLPLKLTIYYNEYRGISWKLRSTSYSDKGGRYILDATINPKFLSGIEDYVTAATYDDMEKAIANFNQEAARISPLLESFEDYSLTRVDYCINFYINELVKGCTSEQIMNLIQRSNIPYKFKQWTEYDKKAHRSKSKCNSFYLKNSSVNINCYDKHSQLLERSFKNEEKGYTPVPSTTLDSANGIIRFEIQCKYHKTYTMSHAPAIEGNHDKNPYETLLSPEYCWDVICNYYNKIIGRGNWYTLSRAVKSVESNNFNRQKEKRLIDALQLVNQCRSVAKAKEAYRSDELESFKRTLIDISHLGINPVTIPKEWGINEIPNLIEKYIELKYMDKLDEDFTNSILNELSKKKRR
jgi:hypothetical protein